MNLISRIRVALNGAVLPFLNIPMPFALVGPGASLRLCRAIADSGVRSVLLVTDAPLVKLGLLDPAIETFKRANISIEIFSEVEPDPGYDVVMKGVERLNACNAEALLAIGGGSPIDCAKAILLSHANRAHPSKLSGLWLYAWPRKRGLPFYVAPTTAGTGSEVTMAAIVSDDEAKTKRSIIDPKILPGMIALDPSLTVGLPDFIAAATGMDALTHAVEAYISTMGTSETNRWALTAARMIARHLPVVYANGADIEAREGMLVGSCLAGMAFTRAGVGYVHAISHQVGARYHLPHGLVNAIVLPHVLDYSKPACASRLADLARAAGLGAGDEGDDALADAFIAMVRHMNAAMKIPTSIVELRREDFDSIIDRAFAEAHGVYGVPRYLTREAAQALLERLAAPSQAKQY